MQILGKTWAFSWRKLTVAENSLCSGILFQGALPKQQNFVPCLTAAPSDSVEMLFRDGAEKMEEGLASSMFSTLASSSSFIVAVVRSKDRKRHLQGTSHRLARSTEKIQ